MPRDLVRVSGPDAATYLQGQCSQDLETLEVGASAESLLLTPQGKIDVYHRATRTAADEFLLDTDPGFGPVMMARLERFRLRVKVAFELLEWEGLAVRGPGAAAAVRTGIGTGPVVPVDWPGWSGVDLLGPGPEGGPDRRVTDAALRCGDAAWEAVRIEAGVPVNGREVVEGSIAAEVGLVERTVSFTKGCFTGQELVARLDARGSKVARRLAGVVVDGYEGPPEALLGASVLTSDAAHVAGALSSVAWSPGLGATVALATLHRRVTPPEAVLVRWEETGATRSLSAQSRPLPLGG
jgi:folate-binding protein YgfZ